MRPKPGKTTNGQESVWSYPRPPRLEPTTRHLRVVVDDVVLADSNRGYRVLETSHPPVYYIPTSDVRMDLLEPMNQQSFCEWKGNAHYFDLTMDGRRIVQVAWAYPAPTAAFAPIKNYLAFYADRVDACFVDDEQVTPQPGGFYGGWITKDIVGPFKGEPNSWGW